MNIVVSQNIDLKSLDGGFLACDHRTGQVHRIEGLAAVALSRIAAGDPGADDPVVAALLDAGIVTMADEHGRAAATGMSRRTMIAAASAVGITTLLLPSAAAAASADAGTSGGEETGVAPAGEAGGTIINFSWASQPVQFRFAWIRPAAEDATPFDYEIEVTATYVAPGNTPAVPTSFTYGPYPALLSTQQWWNGPAGADTRVWYPSSWYESGVGFPTATGNTFTAVFRSLTTPSTTITKTLIG